MTNIINPSGVYDVPQPKSYILNPSIPANSSINFDENSDGKLLNIAGKSIFKHNKIDQTWTPTYYNQHTKISHDNSKHK